MNSIPLYYEYYMRHGLSMTGVDNHTYRNVISNYTLDMLSCYPRFRNQKLEPCTSSVMEWSKNDGKCMDMLSHCFICVIWDTDQVWQGQTTIYITSWPPTTPQTWPSVVTLVLGNTRAWTMHLISDIVVKWWWSMYGYYIPLFYEYYIRYGACLTGVDYHTDHSIISNYAPDMLSCYPGFQNQELEPCTSSVV